HVLRMAIRRRQKIGDVTEAEPPERSLRSLSELHAIYHDVPDALEESLEVAEACSLDLTVRRPSLPSTVLAPGETADARLSQICRARLEGKPGDGRRPRGEYEARLRHELAVIGHRALAGYFLIVGEIAGHAREQGIAVMGRGSAVGSLVAYLLDITTVDPVEHGLYFERFLHAGRKDFPDIDGHVPVERAPKGVLVTQFDMASLAGVGLVKIDLLGNRALSALQEAGESLGGVPAMPDGDAATCAALREGRTVGCFQIETPAM